MTKDPFQNTMFDEGWAPKSMVEEVRSMPTYSELVEEIQHLSARVLDLDLQLQKIKELLYGD